MSRLWLVSVRVLQVKCAHFQLQCSATHTRGPRSRSHQRRHCRTQRLLRAQCWVRLASAPSIGCCSLGLSPWRRSDAFENLDRDATMNVLGAPLLPTPSGCQPARRMAAKVATHVCRIGCLCIPVAAHSRRTLVQKKLECGESGPPTSIFRHPSSSHPLGLICLCRRCQFRPIRRCLRGARTRWDPAATVARERAAARTEGAESADKDRGRQRAEERVSESASRQAGDTCSVLCQSNDGARDP